jgi:ubiquitin-protein ligase
MLLVSLLILEITKHPISGLVAVANPSNVFEWHFLYNLLIRYLFSFFRLQGPPDTDYEGGIYYGIITFPENYPFAAPNIQVCKLICD